MRKIYFLLFFTFFFSTLFAQTAQWTWVSGDNISNQVGSYGTKNIAAAGNKPGSRNYPVGWMDNSGGLWMFGGDGLASNGIGLLNDLWKFDTANNEWTWISGDNAVNRPGEYGKRGTADAQNTPGARRSSISWKDPSGNFWIFGGDGFDAQRTGFLNDLWKFDPATKVWTWIHGDKEINKKGTYGTRGVASDKTEPGSRCYAASWADASGNLWLFGGQGFDENGALDFLNDLWKFDPVTSQWTWVSGFTTIDKRGVYGTKGTPSTSNVPGSRIAPVSWIDPLGDLWLFGGFGFDASGNSSYLSDLWKYNFASNTWTWVSGDNTSNQPGIYGVKGTAAASNKPGSRYYSVGWIDATSKLWLFGGREYNLTGSGYLNDLWKFDPSNNLWTWVSGDNTINQPTVYGVKGVADDANKPGGRMNSISWRGAAGSFWLFGGREFNVSGPVYLNDLWKLSLIPARGSLAVKFVSFLATKENNKTILNWKTAEEIDCKYYVVEHSTDGLHFDSIGTVAATGISGSVNHYIFADVAPAKGNNYYRLKQVDINNRFTYSVIQQIGFDEALFSYKILKNPVSDQLTLILQSGEQAKFKFQVRDVSSSRLMMGGERVLLQGRSTFELPIGSLASGTYTISIFTGKSASTKLFMKQ